MRQLQRQGLHTTWGNPAFKDYVADATFVRLPEPAPGPGCSPVKRGHATLMLDDGFLRLRELVVEFATHVRTACERADCPAPIARDCSGRLGSSGPCWDRTSDTNPTAERDARTTRKVRLVFAPRSHGLRRVTSAGDASENKL